MTIPNPFLIMAHFDLVGLSTEAKPTNLKDGSTYFEVDTSDLYIFYKGTWYKQGEDEEETSEETQSIQNSPRLNDVISIPKELGKIELQENEEIEEVEEGEE